MKRYGALYGKICEMDNLRLALDKAVKGKTWQRQVREVLEDRDGKLKEVQEMLADHTFHTAEYKHKFVYEPKKREIFILPFFPDRIVHHAIMNVLEPLWDSFFIKDSFACRKGKGQHKGGLRCKEFVRRNPYVIQGDVSKFYPSINHGKLKEIVERKIKDKELLWLLFDIIDSTDGVPIGNYLSQWFGNLYLNELDKKVKQEWRVKDYFRYCDDFFIFGDKARLQELKPQVVSFMQDTMKMKLSRCELYPTSRGVDALGYRHFPSGKILVRKSTAKRIRARLKAIPHDLKRGVISIERAEGQLASAYGWLKHANAHNLAYAMNLAELKAVIENAEVQ